jgi:hypothetical protein
LSEGADLPLHARGAVPSHLVNRSSGHVEGVARRVAARNTVDDRSYRSVQHLEVFVLARVKMWRGHRPLSAELRLHLEQVITDPHEPQPPPVLSFQLLTLVGHAGTVPSDGSSRQPTDDGFAGRRSGPRRRKESDASCRRRVDARLGEGPPCRESDSDPASPEAPSRRRAPVNLLETPLVVHGMLVARDKQEP